jgi:hypothetical protein
MHPTISPRNVAISITLSVILASLVSRAREASYGYSSRSVEACKGLVERAMTALRTAEDLTDDDLKLYHLLVAQSSLSTATQIMPSDDLEALTGVKIGPAMTFLRNETSKFVGELPEGGR